MHIGGVDKTDHAQSPSSERQQAFRCTEGSITNSLADNKEDNMSPRRIAISGTNRVTFETARIPPKHITLSLIMHVQTMLSATAMLLLTASALPGKLRS